MTDAGLLGQTWSTAAAAFAAGLAGSGHCLGMCGGIAGSVGAGCPVTGFRRSTLMLGFNLGRVLSYCLLGALLGLLAAVGVDLTGGRGIPLLRILAGLLLIGIGVHLAFHWRGLDRLAALSAPLWRRLTPLFRALLPLRRQYQALFLGLLWGLLPCGLVYAMLATAATTASAWQGLVTMAAFGLGTLPSMLTTSLGGQALLNRLRGPLGRRIAGGLMIAFGVWTATMPLWMALGMGEGSHGGHAHH